MFRGRVACSEWGKSLVLEADRLESGSLFYLTWYIQFKINHTYAPMLIDMCTLTHTIQSIQRSFLCNSANWKCMAQHLISVGEPQLDGVVSIMCCYKISWHTWSLPINVHTSLRPKVCPQIPDQSENYLIHSVSCQNLVNAQGMSHVCEQEWVRSCWFP